MNIEKMSLSELTALNARVEAAIPRVRARELETARKELTDLAAAKGYSLKELIGKTPRKAKAAKASSKLRDAKTGVIWAGRGRIPRNFDKSRAEPYVTVGVI